LTNDLTNRVQAIRIAGLCLTLQVNVTFAYDAEEHCRVVCDHAAPLDCRVVTPAPAGDDRSALNLNKNRTTTCTSQNARQNYTVRAYVLSCPSAIQGCQCLTATSAFCTSGLRRRCKPTAQCNRSHDPLDVVE